MKYLLTILFIISMLVSGCSSTHNTKVKEKYVKSSEMKVLFYKALKASKNKHYTDAAKYYRASAEFGSVPSMVNLGYLHHKGKGIPQDYKKSFFWYKKALSYGPFAIANFNIGIQYHNGWGVQKNHRKAFTNYKIAVQKGERQALNNLGHMYEYGFGVKRSLSLARKYYIDGATKGDSYAIYNLGKLEQKKRNYKAARDWYSKSARLGNKMGFKGLKDLNKRGL